MTDTPKPKQFTVQLDAAAQAMYEHDCRVIPRFSDKTWLKLSERERANYRGSFESGVRSLLDDARRAEKEENYAPRGYLEHIIGDDLP